MEQKGLIYNEKSTQRPRVSEEAVNRVGVIFQASPRKSTRTASRELALPQSMVWHILWKRLKIIPYRLHLLQALNEDDKLKRFYFYCRIRIT
ncbi:hypothetical protein Cfor_08808 [Coptotermes formosanus]|jgi:hypothetical protein|uniref:Uncharacterized protein n=1 Tax=Coptotermes formosanus TaxID=36987 RepID=A0A6L2QA67_COPFO|nr:hypothetical protein Cfor_08808 [Coptotermes formosanus]